MRSRSKKIMFVQALLVGAIAVLAISGCAQRSRTASDSSDTSTPVYTAERPVAVEAGARRYYRDDTGRLYYVEPSGSMRVIERRVRVEPATGGLYTIIDDNNTRYYYDETGRLFSRDDTGRLIYVEENSPGKVIDPLPILTGGHQMQYRSVGFCTDEWKKCTSRCNDAPGLSNKRNCLEDCDFKRQQCLQPY